VSAGHLQGAGTLSLQGRRGWACKPQGAGEPPRPTCRSGARARSHAEQHIWGATTAAGAASRAAAAASAASARASHASSPPAAGGVLAPPPPTASGASNAGAIAARRTRLATATEAGAGSAPS
jgi:hypothetical protein